MARIFHVVDPYTSWGSSLSSALVGTSYDASHTSYNISWREYPLCLMSSGPITESLSIVDSSWIFTIDPVSVWYSNFFCTSIPVWSTQLIVNNDDIALFSVLPDLTLHNLFPIPVSSPTTWDWYFVSSDQSDIDWFCEANMSPIDLQFYSQLNSIQYWSWTEDVIVKSYWDMSISYISILGFLAVIVFIWFLINSFIPTDK